MSNEQRIVPKPWGRERIIEYNEKYALKILEVDAGQRLSLQYHGVKHETMYCLYGTGRLFFIDETGEHEITMMPGRYAVIKPGTVHRLSASITSPVIVIEASSPELDDVIRIEDDCNRFLDPHGH